MGPWFGVIAGGTGTATKREIKKVLQLQHFIINQNTISTFLNIVTL